jgi:hypothetical protein
VQEIVDQLQNQIQEVAGKSAVDAIEQQLPDVLKQTKKMIESLRQNQEGRLQICIDSLKDEI